MSSLESSFLQAQKECDESREREFVRYNTFFESTVKDKSSFDSYLDSVFAGH